MSTALQQLDVPRPAIANLPTMYDLPYDEPSRPGMPDEFHPYQARLLSETFRPPAYQPDNYFAALDMNIYYDPEHPRWYKRPDWFGVVGVPRRYAGSEMRFSYVTWDEGKRPLIIVELLSAGTEDQDLGQVAPTADGTPPKWQVYERILRAPYYAVFSIDAVELRLFRLRGGRYREARGHGGRVWLPEAGLGLGLWQGSYDGHERLWLRWYDAEGQWIPTNEEQAAREREEKDAALILATQERQSANRERQRARQEQQRAEQERQRAEQEHLRAEQERQRAALADRRAEEEQQRADRLAELLRQLGQDPEEL